MPWIDLAPSIKHMQVRRHIPDQISSFQHVFSTESILGNKAFWELISQVINVPYEDLPLENSMCSYRDGNSGGTVYRCNHDVAHSIRKLSYIVQLINLIQIHAGTKTQQFLSSMSIIETNLLYLLMFLERSGRTNEYSSVDDPTILQRSAAIFQYIATIQLNLDSKLVNNFCAILQGNVRRVHKIHASRSLFSDISAEEQFSREKSWFLHQCVITVHHTDLLRCRKTSDMAHYLLEDIAVLLTHAKSYTLLTFRDYLIAFAQHAFLVTGTQYNPETGEIYLDDSSKKIAVISNPGDMLQRLLTPLVNSKAIKIEQNLTESDEAHQALTL